MDRLLIENLTIEYSGYLAVEDISLEVPKGELLTLLGPSGCGKSTTLFSVAGLHNSTSGTIRLGNKVLYDGAGGIFVPPERRDIGLVFQSYALWPHMTVAENLAFPLKLRKVGRADRDKSIVEALALVEMSSYAERYPFELSGGQQQRVALARSIVYRPRLLLLDEPLSNLDAKLRERAKIWLRELQERLGLTTVYVTHDQAEALAISDRVAVLSRGKVMQIGTPHEIYESPASEFLADFIGSSNFVNAKIVGPGLARIATGALVEFNAVRPLGSEDVIIAIRPDRIEVVDPSFQNAIRVRVRRTVYQGSEYQHEAEIDGGSIRFETRHALDDPYQYVAFPKPYVFAFPSEA